MDASSSEDNDGAGEEAATTDAVILWLWNVPAKYSRGEAGGNKVTEVMVCESGRCEEVASRAAYLLRLCTTMSGTERGTGGGERRLCVVRPPQVAISLRAAYALSATLLLYARSPFSTDRA